jgi:hypothetical protein
MIRCCCFDVIARRETSRGDLGAARTGPALAALDCFASLAMTVRIQECRIQ